MKSFASIVLVASLALIPSRALAQFPEAGLNGLSQTAFAIGSETKVRCLGPNLDELAEVITPTDGLHIEIVRPAAGKGVDSQLSTGELIVRVDGSAKPGMATLRLRGRFGVTNPISLLLTQHPVEAIPNDRLSIDTALPIVPGKVYAGSTVDRRSTHLTFTADAGQRVRFVAYSALSQSPTLVDAAVLRPDGNEVVSSRSIGSWPSELDFVAPVPGNYVITVNDFLYRGGETSQYICELGTAVGDDTINLELERLLRPALTANSNRDRFNSTARVWGASEFDVAAETLRTAEAPAAIPVHQVVDLTDGTAEVNFNAEAGQRLLCEVQSWQLDQLTDPRLELFRIPADGNTPALIGEAEDRGPIGERDMRIRGLDPLLEFTAPEAGTYRLRISDNDSAEASADAKRAIVTVTPYQPTFSLLAFSAFPHKDPAVAKPSGVRLMKGGRTAVKAYTARQPGFVGDVEVSLSGLPDALLCEPVIVPAEASQATLVITAKAEAAAWVGPVQISGHPLGDDAAVPVSARVASVTQGATPNRNATQHAIVDDLFIAVSEPDLAPLTVQLGDGSVPEVKVGEKLKLPITLTRQPGSAGECTLRPKDLPPKTKLGEIKIAGDKSAGELELAIEGNARPGTYTFWLETETKVKWHRNPQSLERAEAALVAMQKEAEAGAPNTDAATLQELINAKTADVERLKKETAEKDVTVYIPSNHARFRVVAADAK